MHRLLILPATVVLAVAAAIPAGAQTTSAVDRAAAALRRDPVYIDSGAERAITDAEAEELRARITDSGVPVFVAILPASTATSDSAARRLPSALAEATGLSGTYAVVVGNLFRVASTTSSAADELATSAFQAHGDDGTAMVLLDFVDRLGAEASGGGQPSGGTEARDDDGSGGSSLVLPLLLLGVGTVGFIGVSRRRRRGEERAARAELDSDRMMLHGEIAVLADDVIALEPLVTTRPEARLDYDAAVSRYRVAAAALDYADEPLDMVRVERVVEEARYAMSRARAIVEGREPPLPPEQLRRPGRHDEPPLNVDGSGRPVYEGYAAPFYGGGWFGGGGGLFSGLLLGSMLGGWGWGGTLHGGYGGDAGDGGGFGGGGWDGVGGGDWGGDIGGGDWG